MESGLIKELIAKGGEEVFIQARDKCLCEFGKSICDFGEVVTTVPGELPFKEVYHLVVIPSFANKLDREVFKKGIPKLIKKAEENDVKTMGFPIADKPFASIPFNIFIGFLLRALIEYLLNNESKIENMVFCTYTRGCFQIVKNQFDVFRQEYPI
jgi:O-acetyl-ADP-ribose deacetylase (regulator of RNase III)